MWLQPWGHFGRERFAWNTVMCQLSFLIRSILGCFFLFCFLTLLQADNSSSLIHLAWKPLKDSEHFRDSSNTNVEVGKKTLFTSQQLISNLASAVTLMQVPKVNVYFHKCIRTVKILYDQISWIGGTEPLPLADVTRRCGAMISYWLIFHTVVGMQ